MPIDMDKTAKDFVMLLATVDPVSTLSLFLGLTTGLSADRKAAVAMKSIMYLAIILVGAMAIGQFALDWMDIRMEAFQIAGGSVLFLFGLQMVFGVGAAAGQPGRGEAGHDIAVFPLAVPSIASPGAIMAAVVLTDNDKFGIAQQLATAAMLAVVLAVTWLGMCMAGRVHKVIGDNGAAILVKVMGLLLAALAVEIAMEGVLAVAAGFCRAAAPGA